MCRLRWCVRMAAVVLASTVAAPSQAHIDLQAPEPREHGQDLGPNSNLKRGPCGQVENGRTERLNVFAPGQTIEVTFDEFANHRSYYRVAFDLDGDDDFPLFPGPGVLPEGDDPTRDCPVDGRVILAYELMDGRGGTHTLQVTLPDVECDNCTLQVVQYMYGTGNPYYFQCADLVLSRPPLDAGAVDASDAGDAGLTPAQAPDPQAFRAATSCSERPSSAAEPEPVTEPPPPPPPPVPQRADAGTASIAPSPPLAPARREHDGCSLASDPHRARWVAPVVASAVLALFTRRSGARSARRRSRL